jgi:hypothetical protein
MTQDKESFITSEHRPEVGLKPDTPISELRVRDLHTLLQGAFRSKFGNIENKMWPEFKNSYGKPEKSESKNEWKELKDEKSESDKISFGDKPNKENEGSQPDGEAVSPAIDQLIRTISGLSEQVTSLTQEVQKLKQRSAEG